MKNKIKIVIMTFTILFCFAECFPQNTVTLIKGSFYSITLNNGLVIQGKVISFNSEVILLNTKNGLNEILRQSVLNIKKNGQEFGNDYFISYKKPVYNNFLSINIGFVSPVSTKDENVYYFYYNYSKVELSKGFRLSIAYTGFFSRSIGTRVSITFSGMKNNDISYNTGYSTYNSTGGSLSQFVLGLDFLAGQFHPEKKINFYALAGFGLGTMNGSDVNRNSGYNYNYSYNPEYQFLFSYGIGGGVTYNLSQKISLLTEVTYDYISPEDGYYGKMEQLGIKAGIIFINF